MEKMKSEAFIVVAFGFRKLGHCSQAVNMEYQIKNKDIAVVGNGPGGVERISRHETRC